MEVCDIIHINSKHCACMHYFAKLCTYTHAVLKGLFAYLYKGTHKVLTLNFILHKANYIKARSYFTKSGILPNFLLYIHFQYQF